MVVSVNQRAAVGPACACRTRFPRPSTTRAISSSQPFRTISTFAMIAGLRQRSTASSGDQRLVRSSGTQKAVVASESSLRFSSRLHLHYASRLPFNVLLGTDRNLDTNNNDRPLGFGRNTGRGFDFASLDLRLSGASSLLNASIFNCSPKRSTY